MGELQVTPKVFAEMVALIEDNTISGKIGKDILPELLEGKANDKGVKVRVEGWLYMCPQVLPQGEVTSAGLILLRR